MNPTMISALRNSKYLGVCIRAPASTDTRSINLALLVDTSMSMSGDRLDSVKRTLRGARDLFRSDDQVTLVTFGDRATTVTDHMAMTPEGLTAFYASIDAIETGGCTNLSAGIEELLIRQRDPPYDAILLLTDGIVNRGVVSTIGIRTMALGLGSMPITALGYGADHNRILLRDLAVRSRGSYNYIDSEEILPITMGDMLGGLRTEVLKEAMLSVPLGWTCCEVGCSPLSSSFMVGNIVPDRDYWVVFKGAEAEAEGPIVLSAAAFREESRCIPFSDCQELQEQVLRSRVAKAIMDASDLMELGRPIGDTVLALDAEFKVLSDSMKARPLILRMQAQLAEVLNSVQQTGQVQSDSLARMASGAAGLSIQRGVSTPTSGNPCNNQTFSSPLQRLTSTQVQNKSAI